jgi:two-component system, cell cycle sensor histidine kinase and response regulator CckA
MNTILLVDDEPHVRALVRDVLEMSDYRVVEAGSAAEAEVVEASWSEDIDLLLTDVRMPGLTGPELAAKLRARRPDMKVIYMSAFTAADMVSQGIDIALGVAVITKPFTVVALTETVDGAMAAQHAMACSVGGGQSGE